ncbi:hypothetical protein DB31_1465 [Hyalangium minutum]|uniref:Uncharacterized protein n=1 Tax=Hyalangium minutum TaxID=394096 RepID=A0A085WCD6_9BACT|nr:hypothetical protein DB31_1465 [Hyalangium minutum]
MLEGVEHVLLPSEEPHPPRLRLADRGLAPQPRVEGVRVGPDFWGQQVGPFTHERECLGFIAQRLYRRGVSAARAMDPARATLVDVKVPIGILFARCGAREMKGRLSIVAKVRLFGAAPGLDNAVQDLGAGSRQAGIAPLDCCLDQELRAVRGGAQRAWEIARAGRLTRGAVRTEGLIRGPGGHRIRHLSEAVVLAHAAARCQTSTQRGPSRIEVQARAGRTGRGVAEVGRVLWVTSRPVGAEGLTVLPRGIDSSVGGGATVRSRIRYRGTGIGPSVRVIVRATHDGKKSSNAEEGHDVAHESLGS